MRFAPCFLGFAFPPRRSSRRNFHGLGISQEHVSLPNARDTNRDAFRQGLRDLGYIEGNNIQVEYRYGAGNTERAKSLVTEFLQLKIDIIVSPVVSRISPRQASNPNDSHCDCRKSRSCCDGDGW